ncbi:MAG: hypothetical protein QOK37_4270 [Thermoanaerobaculia bacterium]|jgi:hypothetical protein|nr:hypothetical protein [Thermoanaerobaculia bacterium]
MTREIDAAMQEDRPEKRRVRALWMEQLRSYKAAYPNDSVPLYLTLSGAEGRDVQLLIREGLIRVTEVGSIATSDQGIAVAIESNVNAVWELQRRIPGLKILEQPFDSIMRSTKLTVFPQGDHVKFCQARVVNLDLNQAVKFENVDGELQFPPLQWIRKLCILHAEQRLEWCLLLTLHGETLWESNETKSVAAFLSENFGREPSFAAAAINVLGEELYQRVNDGTIPAARRLEISEQQKLLMLYVPKRIAQIAHEYGWRSETLHNLRYGGISRRAPMVTWIIDFRWDQRVSSEPDRIYLDSLKLLLAGAGQIAEDGTLS